MGIRFGKQVFCLTFLVDFFVRFHKLGYFHIFRYPKMLDPMIQTFTEIIIRLNVT